MIEDLVLVEEPDDDTITISEHLMRRDGSVRLVLLVKDVADATAMLGGCGGQLTRSGSDVLIEWNWTRGMVPPNEDDLCSTLVRRALLAWAAEFLGEPIQMHRLT